MGKIRDFLDNHGVLIRSAAVGVWTLLCMAFVLFIAICVYDTENSRAALITGICIAALIAVFGVYLIARQKNVFRDFYSPEVPLYRQHKTVRKKVSDAYAAHRMETDPKGLLENELAPNPMLIGAGNTAYFGRFFKLVDNCGCSRGEFDRDYFYGEIFRGNMNMLNIGEMFTIYCNTDADQFIFNNSDIVYVGPYVETDTVRVGLFTQVVQSFNIKIKLADEDFYHVLKCAPYMDRPIIDAFRARRKLLNPQCEIFIYPED